MKETLSGKNKIQQICDILKKETLEPARQEASEVIENAHMQAKEILEKAQKEVEKMKLSAEKAIADQKKAFDASLSMASQQAIEILKQQIEKQFFRQELNQMVAKGQADLQIIVKLIEVIIQAIEKEGVNSDLTVAIGKQLDPRKVNELLAKDILAKLREKAVVLGGFAAGIEVKIHKEKITLDLTDQALTELLARFIRRDFRDFFFQEK